MDLKCIVGIVMFVLPFVALFIVCVKCDGWKVTLVAC